MAERVVIAIPTCKRPESLARLLDAIAALDTDAEIFVLVADNDSRGHQGFDLCETRAPRYRWPLRAVIEPVRGIAPVRNRLVSEALKTDFVCAQADDSGFVVTSAAPNPALALMKSRRFMRFLQQL